MLAWFLTSKPSDKIYLIKAKSLPQQIKINIKLLAYTKSALQPNNEKDNFNEY